MFHVILSLCSPAKKKHKKTHLVTESLIQSRRAETGSYI